MKHYLVVIHRRKNDRAGNPQDNIKVFRIKNNVPTKIHESDEIHVGYRGHDQAALETITAEERLVFSDQEVKAMGDSFVEFYCGRRNHACMRSGASYDPASWRRQEGKIKLHFVYAN